MANTYPALYYHVVFSTKNREPWMDRTIRPRVWAYMGGVARENRMMAMEVGGVADHVHLLLSLPATASVADAVKHIKGGSSRWLKEAFPNLSAFAWQDGYGAFTESRARIDEVCEYIRAQEEHHRTKTFAEEYREFVERNGIEYDERYLLG
jgi:putative transposase